MNFINRKEIISRMIDASKEDRDRFFKVADTMHLQPKYNDKLEELETENQKWRDMTNIPNYPNIKFPLEIPLWFPHIKFASSWDETYLDVSMKNQSEQEELYAIKDRL